MAGKKPDVTVGGPKGRPPTQEEAEAMADALFAKMAAARSKAARGK